MNKRSILIPVASFVGLFMLSGCQNDGAQLTAPDVGASETPQFIDIPSGLRFQKVLATSRRITKKDGGSLELKYEEEVSGREFKRNVELKFERQSVSNDFDASLSMDAQYLMNRVGLQFGPHGTYFLKPAKLQITVCECPDDLPLLQQQWKMGTDEG